jgi:hypothetical protein
MRRKPETYEQVKNRLEASAEDLRRKKALLKFGQKALDILNENKQQQLVRKEWESKLGSAADELGLL